MTLKNLVVRPVRLIAALALLCTVLSLPQQSRAQAGKAITYDTPVESQITDAAPEEVWTLNAQAKDRLSIVVERTGGTLVPRVELLDSNSQRVTSADADETGARAEVTAVNIPGAGAFSVKVGRYGEKDGKTNGNYRLTVSVLGTAEDSPLLKLDPQPITYDKAVNGELTNAKWKQGWTLSATGKDVITVTATRTDGTIRPQLDLLDNSGNSVTQGFLGRGADQAEISHFRLPGPGQYTVVVLRENKQGGRSSGKYTLTVTLDGAGADRPDLAKTQGALTADGTVNGTLTNAKWLDVWSYEAQSKDRIRLRVHRVDGTLVPVLYLFGANNQEIRRDYANEDGSYAEFDQDLPGPGKYQVRVGRADDDGGESAGKYELSLIVLGTGEDNPSFKTIAGTVEVGSTVKGNLTGAKWRDSWTFNAKSADPLNISVKRTGGTLIPAIRILGANQQDITTIYTDDTFSVAANPEFRVPGPGQYTIVVERRDGVRGGTTGAYELSVTQGQKQ